LFLEERECVRIATAAYQVLHSEKVTAKKPPVRCVLRLTEPGLLDVVRRHRIKTDPTDRIQLEILNSHEVAATSMVREATANSAGGRIHKIMVLGLGTHHRLGEMVVLRAIKDHVIAGDGRDGDKLDIHVFDKQSAEWVEAFRSRYPFADRVCTITAHSCWARKAGASAFEPGYDAAFVCIPDEGHATAQAVMLRREVLTRGEPIMVRVLFSRSGYGELLGDPASGWGDNLHAVGLEDSLFDPDTATQPEIEMRAQTIHHDYRRLKRKEYLAAADDEARRKSAEQSANRPWLLLGEADRDQNRQLAEKYDEYLGMVLPGKPTQYRRVFRPIPLDIEAGVGGMTATELEAIAEVEHGRWLASKREQGFTFGEDRSKKQNPFLIEWADLTEEQKDYATDFARGMTRILAMADYAIVSDTNVKVAGSSRS